MNEKIYIQTSVVAILNKFQNILYDQVIYFEKNLEPTINALPRIYTQKMLDK